MPTDKQLKTYRKVIRDTELFREIWGKGVPGLRFLGSPHEDDPMNDAELVLHELAHQTLMPVGVIFSPGAMNHSIRWISGYLNKLPRYRQDLHELKAVAIEILVGKRMGLCLNRRALVRGARRNSELFQKKSVKVVDRLIRRAQRLPHIQYRADTIMEFVAQQRKEFRCKPNKKNESSQ